ncbi:MAG: thioredoxin family protein [Bacteroidota bacterium]
MKNLIAVIFLLLPVFYGCATVKPAKVVSPVVEQTLAPVINFSEQSTWLLGYFSPGQLTREPHSTWYFKGYDDYRFNTDAVNNLTVINKDDITIKIVMGTWCPDSRREVPRFMRILYIWQFPVEKVTFIGVDNAKLSPVGEYNKLDIQRVPTFIIYKNNIEAGRIIENPTTSLEQDMVNILKRNE